MKALVKETKDKSYVYKDVPVPEPGPGELLVKPIKVGLCGSDIHFYDWTSGKQSPGRSRPAVLLPRLFTCPTVADVIGTVPFTPGHEMVAEVSSN